MWGGGPGGWAVPLWGAAGQSRPLACSRIRVLSRTEVPRPPRVTGMLSGGAPGTGKAGKAGKTGDSRGSPRVRWPALGPNSITGRLSEPGQGTLTSAGLSVLNHKMETAPMLIVGLGDVSPHTREPNLPGIIQVFHTNSHLRDQWGSSARLPPSLDHWSLTTCVKPIPDTQ